MTVARGKQQSTLLLLATLAALLLMQSHAEAACSSPAGNAGDMFFSSVQNVMVYCNGTSWVAMGLNQVVNFGTLTTGDFCTATSGTAIACNTATIPIGSPAPIAGLSVLGNGTNAAGNVTAITGAANQVLVVNNAGTSLAFGAVNLGSSAAITGTLPIANGGTNIGSQTTNGVAYYNGTSITTGTGFVYSGVNVGIGTTAPVAELEASGGSIYDTSDQSGAAPQQITIRGKTNNNQQLLLGYNTSSNYGSIGAIQQGVAWEPLVLQEGGGNVAIGTTGPVAPLQVYGVAGSPSLSADTTDTAVINPSSTVQLAMGGYTTSPYAFWMQTKNSSNSGASYALSLNPLGGNVGIGTTAPTQMLDVKGTVLVDGNGTREYFRDTSHGYFYDDTNFHLESGSSSDTLWINGNTAASVEMAAGGGNIYLPGSGIWNSSGNVGIGTPTPQANLQVNGNADVGNTLFVGNGVASLTTTGTSFGALGWDSTNNAFMIQPQTVNTAWRNLELNPNGGNVGIGVTSPSAKLDVEGPGGGISADAIFNNGTVYIRDRGDGCCSQLSQTSGNTRWDTYVSNSAGAYYLYQVSNASGGTGLGQWLTIANNGNVGIGNTNPSATLHVEYASANGGVSTPALILDNPSGGSQTVLSFRLNNSAYANIRSDNAGNIILSGSGSGSVYLGYPDLGSSIGTLTNNGGVGSFSDLRLKKDIRPIDGREALDKISQLRPVLFNWINPTMHGSSASGGFVAQDVAKVLPHLVDQVSCMGEDCALVGGGKAYALSLTPEFSAYLVKSVQQLKADNDNLRAANDNEAAQIKTLTARLDALEAAQR